ncbi:hypothetical protein SCHPADRAFT_888645 [Schizopora paradoxa]|uniref:SH3 domain-containing protein n=1 Tax=Schizopora paradoxa TaxID=27342 RepID=A0A0H2RTD6_9AGAM|nr:hypothetical protein SCHPADRAFT_888645 [Schizopora paradoxa]
MAPLNNLFKRIGVAQEAASSSDGTSSVAYVGFGVAGLFVLGVVGSLFFLWYRRKRKQEREEERGLAFLTVKGVLKEGSGSTEPLPSDLLNIQKNKNGFSRANLTASIVLPEKSIIRPTATREEIISFYEEKGDLPKPFAPFHFALNASSSSSSSSLDTLTPPMPVMTSKKDYRVSTDSFSASAAHLAPPPSPGKRGSVFSFSFPDAFAPSRRHSKAMSSISSIFSTSGSSTVGGKGLQMQRVKQLFTPILPDEPTLILGERVAIMKSHDDGWCIVGRDKPYGKPGEVELGAVPAWCFVKPMKGLRSERPVRSTSLGVTVQMDDEHEKPRGDYISWSNF